VELTSLSAVGAVSAGASHSLALASDGTVFAFGENAEGQLGDGGVVGYATLPQVVAGISNAVSVVASSNHSLAVTVDEVVWSWGRNGSGQLGDGTTVARVVPVSICESGFVWKVGTPALSPGGGLYMNAVTVTLSTVTSGATVRYTLDGSEPGPGSTLYTGAFSVTQSGTVKARAWKTGVPTSNVGSGAFELQVVSPVATPGTGTYATAPVVTLSTTTSGATIRYTLDGSEPSESSLVYASGVAVESTGALKAKAFKAGWTGSGTTTATYTLQVGTPVLSPGGGSYGSAQQVTASTVTPGATLRYTRSGGEPSELDVVVPGEGIAVAQSGALRVKGWKAGWTASGTASGSYVVSLGTAASPSFAPAGGSYGTAVLVTLSSATLGASVRYTLDGTDPGPQSALYTGPVTLSSTATLKARAYRNDMQPSVVSSASYVVSSGAVSTPELSVASGRYTTSRAVTVSVATPGATIRYTTSGADPVESDAEVSSGGTVLVERALVLKARAWKAGQPASAVARRDYVVTGAVSAGGSHTLGLRADGSVWAWGANGSGQLGDGTTTQRTTPVAVSGLTGVVAIAAGGQHSLALGSDGSVWSWGANGSGQLGDGTTTQRTCCLSRWSIW
jgi:hypothetical protein